MPHSARDDATFLKTPTILKDYRPFLSRLVFRHNRETIDISATCRRQKILARSMLIKTVSTSRVCPLQKIFSDAATFCRTLDEQAGTARKNPLNE